MAAVKPTTKAKANKLGGLVTPVGDALFVSAPRASAFDSTKQESSIVLSAEDHAKFLAELNAKIDGYDGDLVVPKDKITYPFKPATDKEGNETGDMIWKAKTSIQYPAKFYDSKGTMFQPDMNFQVANRSKIRLSVSGEVITTSLYKGVVLRLNAIKIVSTTPWASANPFAGESDDGDFSYSAEAQTASTASDFGDDDWA